MPKFCKLFVVGLFLASFPINAQQTELLQNDQQDFNRALALYQKEQFQWAQTLFNRVILTAGSNEVRSDCAFYSAHCALLLEQQGGSARMESFLVDYPNSSKRNMALLYLAQAYFSQGRYPQAIENFNAISEDSLQPSDQELLIFQKGFCYFSAKNTTEATACFKRVANSKLFGAQAKYYLGFMAYESNDYKQAAIFFDEVSGEEKYKQKLSYFQADMNFNQGNFEKAIELALLSINKANAAEKSELNKIIGESYFNLKQYKKAIPYLSEFKGRKGKWSNTDYYQLGYAYYKQGEFQNAVTQFNKIIGGNDFVAQNAYYHLAESYLNLSLKQQALNAFKNASEMSFDRKIQEDAALNYAKLSYEVGNSYQSVPDVLASFLEVYPASPSRPEIESLLIDSYVTSKNYAGALALLDKSKIVNDHIYQKVTFYRGLELFGDGKYRDALDLFTKSTARSANPKLLARATFWKAESHYGLDDFIGARDAYNIFFKLESATTIAEFKNAAYNMAYACFKLREYEQAATFFEKFIESAPADQLRLNDAYLRLGDSRFVSAKYWPAMDAYNKAIEMKGMDADYAAFQKAISYGFVGRNEKKIEDFNRFLQQFPKSKYVDDVLFELGNTYVAEKNTAAALKTYDQVIAAKGTLAVKALLRQGLILYNDENDNMALTKFKRIAADYPGTPESLEAVATAKIIFVDTGRMDEYASWVKTLEFVSVSDAELEVDTWKAAEKQYLQNTDQAQQTLLGYLKKFPAGAHALQANYYLAQLYFSKNKPQEAVPYYEYVAQAAKSEYTEPTLARLAEILLEGDNHTKTAAILKRLEEEADFPQNIIFAQSNLLQIYFQEKDYQNAINYAEKIISTPKLDEMVRIKAQVILARVALQSGEEAKARDAYKNLMAYSGEVAAEANYYDAYFKHKDQKFEDSNAAVQKFTKNYAGYKYYGAKALVLMAKNFYALKDSFQATYILESVIKNFKNYEDVISEATAELELIKAEESKTNESITK